MVVASLKIPQQRDFSVFFGKRASTAISVSRKSVGPRSPQPPALRVEVTALALRKRQGFLLHSLLLPISPSSGGVASGSPPLHSAAKGSQRRFSVRRWLVLSCAVGGAQIGSQGVTQRIELRGEIWLHLSPVAGVGAGGIGLPLSEWGGWYSEGFHCAFDRTW